MPICSALFTPHTAGIGHVRTRRGSNRRTLPSAASKARHYGHDSARDDDAPVLTACESKLTAAWKRCGGRWHVEERHLACRSRLTRSDNGSAGSGGTLGYPACCREEVLGVLRSARARALAMGQWHARTHTQRAPAPRTAGCRDPHREADENILRPKILKLRAAHAGR